MGKGSKKSAPSTLSKMQRSELIQAINETTSLFEILALTRIEDPLVRLKAVEQMCPCKVDGDYEEFWHRIIELAKDEDPKIRYQVMHNLCDGSPDHMEDRVMETMEIFNRDPDKDIRRKAHKVIASYDKTGKWNIM